MDTSSEQTKEKSNSKNPTEEPSWFYRNRVRLTVSAVYAFLIVFSLKIIRGWLEQTGNDNSTHPQKHLEDTSMATSKKGTDCESIQTSCGNDQPLTDNTFDCWDFIQEYDSLILIGVLAVFALICSFFWDNTKSGCHCFKKYSLLLIFVALWLTGQPLLFLFPPIFIALFCHLAPAKRELNTGALEPKKIYLNREVIVSKLYNLVESLAQWASSPKAASLDGANTNIALIGAWGTGKTFIFNRVAERLQSAKAREGSPLDIRMAYVSPWNSNSPEEAEKSIISSLIAATYEEGSFHASIYKNKWLTSLLEVLPNQSGNIARMLAEYIATTHSSSLEELAKELSDAIRNPIVLFVDDMDRALPAVVKSIFPIMDRLCKIPNIIVVAAIDKDNLRESLGMEEDTIMGYIKKLFLHRQELTAPTEEELLEMANGLLAESECEFTPQIINYYRSLNKDGNLSVSCNPRGVEQVIVATEFFEKTISCDGVHPYDRYGIKKYTHLFYILECFKSDYPEAYNEMASTSRNTYFDIQHENKVYKPSDAWKEKYALSAKLYKESARFQKQYMNMVNHFIIHNTSIYDPTIFDSNDVTYLVSGDIYKYSIITTHRVYALINAYYSQGAGTKLIEAIHDITNIENFGEESVVNTFWKRLKETVKNDIHNKKTPIPLKYINNILCADSYNVSPSAAWDIYEAITLYRQEKSEEIESALNALFIRADLDTYKNIIRPTYITHDFWGDKTEGQKEKEKELQRLVEPAVLASITGRLFSVNDLHSIPNRYKTMMELGEIFVYGGITKPIRQKDTSIKDKLKALIYTHDNISVDPNVNAKFFYLESPIFSLLLKEALQLTVPDLNELREVGDPNIDLVITLGTEFIESSRAYYLKNKPNVSPNDVNSLIEQLYRLEEIITEFVSPSQ